MRKYVCLFFILINLIACQIPDSEEEKLRRINQTLEKNYLNSHDLVLSSIRTLKKQVEKEGNTLEGRERVKRFTNLYKQVKEVLQKINHIKQLIYPRTAQEAEELMLGKNRDGLGYQLAKDLETYRHWLVDEYKDMGLSLADFPSLVEVYYSKPLDFAQANFKNTSVSTMLSLLSLKQLEVIRYQQEILKKFSAAEWGIEYRRKPLWTAWADAKSNYVLEDADYEVDIFLIQHILDYPTEFKEVKINQLPASISSQNEAFWEMKAEKLGKQTLEIQITYPFKGKDTTVNIRKNYEVFPAKTQK